MKWSPCSCIFSSWGSQHRCHSSETFLKMTKLLGLHNECLSLYGAVFTLFVATYTTSNISLDKRNNLENLGRPLIWNNGIREDVMHRCSQVWRSVRREEKNRYLWKDQTKRLVTMSGGTGVGLRLHHSHNMQGAWIQRQKCEAVDTPPISTSGSRLGLFLLGGSSCDYNQVWDVFTDKWCLLDGNMTTTKIDERKWSSSDPDQVRCRGVSQTDGEHSMECLCWRLSSGPASHETRTGNLSK